jgi:hypothetical protein
MEPDCSELRNARESLVRAWNVLQDLRLTLEAFSSEPPRRPTKRSFVEEGELLSESLVQELARLNRQVRTLQEAVAAVKPYLGKGQNDGQYPHLLQRLNKAIETSVLSEEVVCEIIARARRRRQRVSSD